MPESSESIIDYPPSPRPSLVDSIIMTYRAHHTRERIVSHREAIEVDQMWSDWGEQIVAFAQVSGQIGIDYLKIQPGQPMIDCKPGSNRYSFFDDYKSADYLTAILRDHAPDVAVPAQITAEAFLDGERLDTPYVFKDVSANRGINKLLINDTERETKLRRFLSAFRRTESLRDLMLEAFIASPANIPSTYRYTMTPTGTILAASLLSARAGAPPQTDRYFQPLTDTRSPYFLNSPAIASNLSQGGIAVGLDFAERRFELANLDAERERILTAHGIDSITRTAPERVTAAARNIARAIGPSIGLLIGVDIIQQADTSTPYYLEANSLPSESPINETIHPALEPLSQRTLKFMALQQTLEDLMA